VDRGGRTGQRSPGVSAAADGPRRLGEPQRYLGVRRRGRRGVAADRRGTPRARARPVSHRIRPLGDQAPRTPDVVPTDVRGARRVARPDCSLGNGGREQPERPAAPATLRAGRLGGDGVRQRRGGYDPRGRLRPLRRRRHRILNRRRATGTRRRRLRPNRVQHGSVRTTADGSPGRNRRPHRALEEPGFRHLGHRLAGTRSRDACRGPRYDAGPGRGGAPAHRRDRRGDRHDGGRDRLRRRRGRARAGRASRRAGRRGTGTARPRPAHVVARGSVPLRSGGRPQTGHRRERPRRQTRRFSGELLRDALARPADCRRRRPPDPERRADLPPRVTGQRLLARRHLHRTDRRGDGVSSRGSEATGIQHDPRPLEVRDAAFLLSHGSTRAVRLAGHPQYGRLRAQPGPGGHRGIQRRDDGHDLPARHSPLYRRLVDL